jgi:hypothetical protein
MRKSAGMDDDGAHRPNDDGFHRATHEWWVRRHHRDMADPVYRDE